LEADVVETSYCGRARGGAQDRWRRVARTRVWWGLGRAAATGRLDGRQGYLAGHRFAQAGGKGGEAGGVDV
jgi:hypothetical protein